MSSNARTRQKPKEYTLFDVVYEDGSQTSNRKVPTAELESPGGDGAAKAFIESQDRKIAEASGRSRGVIKTILRSR
ncbi:hypothetical protein [Oleispirillum naphthae]|uniref:hypothetical protein n=1 Tax=Oleispirillum naphthae TaxID=2838853 RepID=UPI0030825815